VGAMVGFGGLGVMGWRLSHGCVYVGEVGGVADGLNSKDVGVVLTVVDWAVAMK
jgi:hypothetical protein